MTEIFRIIGKNDIHFDAGPTGNYLFTQGKPPRKLSTVLTRQEVLSLLPRLPLGIRPMALKHGLSVITMELNIQGVSATDMEAKQHDLIETLEETELYFSSRGARGTKAELQIKSPGASEVSFKSVFYGVLDELDARDVLGAVIKAHRLEGLQLILYCQENWRPGTFNYLFNGGFEFWDGVPYGGTGADTEPDGWTDYEHVNITGTNNREGATIQQGSYALRINVTNSAGGGQHKGIYRDILDRLKPGVTYTLIAWIRNAALTDCRIEVSAVGDVSGTASAYSGTAVHAVYTRCTVAFTPNSNDTYLRIYAYLLSSAPGASGTLYVDGMMVVRGAVVPDDFIEWHPNPGIRIGPNLLSNADFEEWPADITDNEPDCWTNLESVSAGTHVNNRESIEVVQGCYALEIDVNGILNGEYKGVRQNIFSRVTAGTEYVYLAWIKNATITRGNLEIEAFGDNSGSRWAYIDDDANAEYTRYAVTFTPTVGDTLLYINAYIRAIADNCIGTAYIDKLMVIEASVYNGHSFAPEEWTGCGYIYNHYDGPCGAAPPSTDCGHVNYLDVDDLRGDVDCRLRLTARYLSTTANEYLTRLMIARKTGPCHPCQFTHRLEAEAAAAQPYWPDHDDNTRSGCKVVSQGAGRTDGYVEWRIVADHLCQQGRFRVLAAVYADYDGAVDTNIKFRSYVSGFSQNIYGVYKQPLIDATWHWLDLGVFDISGQYWGPERPQYIHWWVNYQKEDADIVELDFILLLPEDESVLRIDTAQISGLLQNDEFIWDNSADFIERVENNWTGGVLWFLIAHPRLVAEPLGLAPDRENRLIFAMGHHESDACHYQGCIVHEHDGEPMRIEMSYLPQYISPLE